MTTLPEGLLLLARDDETGEPVRGLDRGRFNRALILAALGELALRGRLRVLGPEEPSISGAALSRLRETIRTRSRTGQTTDVDDGPLVFLRLTDDTPTGHTYPDRLLASLAASDTGRDRAHTLTALALLYLGHRPGPERATVMVEDQTPYVATDLIARGALRTVTRPGGFLRPPATLLLPSQKSDSGEDGLRLRLKTAVMGEWYRSDDATQCHLALVRAVGLTDTVFGPDLAARHAQQFWHEAYEQPRPEPTARLAAALFHCVRGEPDHFDLATL